MPTYHGRCHCGAIKFEFDSQPISKGLRCNCSICVRKGALMSPMTLSPDELRIDASDESLGCYQFGSGVAKHYFCKVCGIYTFNQTLRQPGFYRVNLGCIDELDSSVLPADLFDGRHLI